MKTSITILFMGCILMAAPVVYSGEHRSMSDVQHRKHMGGLHHPEHSEDASMQGVDEKTSTMSDAQHRKHMGGLHHPDNADAAEHDDEKDGVGMSDVQHRKHMGGLHHPKSE